MSCQFRRYVFYNQFRLSKSQTQNGIHHSKISNYVCVPQSESKISCTGGGEGGAGGERNFCCVSKFPESIC